MCIRDRKEEFVKDFVFPMLRANAFYENNYLLGTSIARPLIAKEQIRVAGLENAEGIIVQFSLESVCTESAKRHRQHAAE